MGKRKLMNLCNLGSYSTYKKLASYRKPNQDNKENVSKCDNTVIPADSTYRIPLAKVKLLIGLYYRFAGRSRRFMDAYAYGADGKLAIWASKTYKGHRMPPKEDMLVDYNKKHNI